MGGAKFYERQEVKDLLAYLRLVSNPFDLVSFRRSVNAPARGVGPTTLARIEAAIPDGGTALEGVAVLLRGGELKGRAQRELARFLDLFGRAAGEARALGLAALVRWVLVESGYVQMLEEEATLEAEGRLRNLEEFISAAAEAESLGLRLAEFLDRVTLASDTDELEEAALLSLMTIHCAKGLEFPVVFLVGMEEDVFPNRNARETEDGIEEERRLFYVAITRAQHKLYLTAARRRRMMGQEVLGMPSRFLRELPADGLETPIRWGTELYQSGQGAQAPTRLSGGGSVSEELNRIRGFFERVKGVAAARPPSAPRGPPCRGHRRSHGSGLRRLAQGHPGAQPALRQGGHHRRHRQRRRAHLHGALRRRGAANRGAVRHAGERQLELDAQPCQELVVPHRQDLQRQGDCLPGAAPFGRQQVGYADVAQHAAQADVTGTSCCWGAWAGRGCARNGPTARSGRIGCNPWRRRRRSWPPTTCPCGSRGLAPRPGRGLRMRAGRRPRS